MPRIKHGFHTGVLASLLSIGLNSWASAPQTPALNLMPYPQQVELTTGHWVLNSSAALALSSPDQAPINAALERFRARFQRHTQTSLILSENHKSTQRLVIELTEEPNNEPWGEGRIPLDVLAPHREAYRLSIDADRIHLQSASYQGINHGLETLLQLLITTAQPDGKQRISLPQLTIDDAPRFRWRGLMLDSVRHFFSVETIKRQLDGMAAAKLNIFHWHLTDDQGWRMESRHYPKLHEQASDGLYYTRDEIREIVAYAKLRGIQVVPEINMPGHSSAIGVAYPELMSAPGPYTPEDRWGVHTPLLNPANEDVYIFADKIFAEVVELFPFAYVHIGGDEVDPRDWLANAEIQGFMAHNNLTTPEELHTYFNQRLARILADHDRKMIGWDEIFHPGLPEGTVVQSWRGPDALGEVANQGYPAILSTGFYLDQPQPTAYHYRNPIFPLPQDTNDQPEPDEHWETWRFELPRQRGSAVTGQFTLIEHPEQGSRGFIDFADKSRQVLQNLEGRGNITYFEVDTWMGPVLGRVEFHNGQLGGDMVVGNAPYPATGELVAGRHLPGTSIPAPIPIPVIDKAKQPWVLGAEAALWAEIVDERHIDLRLWPRTFAVAERLWSSAELTDEDFMYQRLAVIADWSELSLGLQHRTQPETALRKLLPLNQIEAAQVLSEAVEPAQYYHRHHEKSVHGTYSRRDPLDRFVDTLPVESHPVRQLNQQLNAWRESPDNPALAADARATLVNWRDNAQQVLASLNTGDDPGRLRVIAEQVHTATQWGIVLIDTLSHQTGLSDAVIRSARRQLRTAQSIHEEVVVAAAYPIERLLDDVHTK